MHSVIGVDMDGVIADFVGDALNIVNEYWDLGLKYEDIKKPRLGRQVSNLLKDRGIEVSPEDVYSEISQSGYFEDLPVIDGAIDAVKEIAKKNRVVFVSKAMEWDRCPGEKVRWLNRYFSDIDFNFVLVDQFETKALMNLDFMIDDDPRTLSALKIAVPIAVEHPWNQEYLDSNPSIIRVSSIKHAPKTIEYFQQNIFCF